MLEARRIPPRTAAKKALADWSQVESVAARRLAAAAMLSRRFGSSASK